MTDIKIELNTAILDRMDREMDGKADKAVGKIAFEAESKTKQLMQGGRTGRVYPVPGSPGRTYTASAPGEAPAVVTGMLKSSIQAKREKNRVWAVLVSAEYAADLEYGHRTDEGGYVAPRPYLRPAVWSVISEFAKELLKALD